MKSAPGCPILVRLTILGTLVTLLACASLYADPVVHKFQLWGTMNPLEKLIFYQGWTNGFLVARGQSGVELATCLDKITGDQAIAMIDKRYKDHPERWSRPITQQMLQALTAEGGLVKERIRYRRTQDDQLPGAPAVAVRLCNSSSSRGASCQMLPAPSVSIMSPGCAALAASVTASGKDET